jgi:quercetin dioxygenase-like cupin family protein
MSTDSFSDFEAEARAQGFDEVTERHWDPKAVLETHTHPIAVRALVMRGDMWLTIGNDTRHLRPGDTFELGRDVPHAEQYGVEGATYWVARRRGEA